jgi:NAD(P)-dependent dehydrogenase (short-subunit alcohol dehydrogenase family)
MAPQLAYRIGPVSGAGPGIGRTAAARLADAGARRGIMSRVGGSVVRASEAGFIAHRL